MNFFWGTEDSFNKFEGSLPRTFDRARTRTLLAGIIEIILLFVKLQTNHLIFSYRCIGYLRRKLVGVACEPCKLKVPKLLGSNGMILIHMCENILRNCELIQRIWGPVYGKSLTRARARGLSTRILKIVVQQSNTIVHNGWKFQINLLLFFINSGFQNEGYSWGSRVSPRR